MAKVRTILTKRFRYVRILEPYPTPPYDPNDDTIISTQPENKILQQMVEEWDMDGHFSTKWVDVPIVMIEKENE